MTISIGFTIHDAARDGRAFQLEEADLGKPLVFGTQGNVALQARGVLRSHFVLLPHEGTLLAASSDPRMPLYADEAPIGTDWTALTVPCRLRAGSAVIDLFVAAAPELDLESTRAGPLQLPAPKDRAPSPGTPSMAVRAVTRLRDDYQRLSRVKRLMVPLAGLLALLAVAQPVRAGERTSSPTLPAAAVPNALERPSAQPAALPVVPRGPLPSARSLPGESRSALGPQERVVYHKAIEAMLAGDFQTAHRLYDALAQAHPDAADIRAAQRVLAAKIRKAH